MTETETGPKPDPEATLPLSPVPDSAADPEYASVEREAP